MGLIFLVGFELGQPGTHLVGVSVLGLDVLLVSAPLLDGGLHCGVGFLQRLLGLAQWRFNGVETFRDPSPLVGDLHDAKIKFLQFDERR